MGKWRRRKRKKGQAERRDKRGGEWRKKRRKRNDSKRGEREAAM